MRRTAQTPVQAAPAPASVPAAGNQADAQRAQHLALLVSSLQAFYRSHARDLPWRRSQDPYAIWVSEIMLQQTRVDTVVPRYRAFLRTYPNIAALAAATASDVCAAWAGLGYYRRARHLHAAAQQVCREFAGELPQTAAQLRKVVGIGPYTAGAIASIAFGEATALVDGNVSRILARIFAESAFIDTPAGSRVFWGLAARLVAIAAQTGLPGDFNQALMELGATVCTPQRPRCGSCPVQSHCLALATSQVAALPRKRGKVVVKPLQITFVQCQTPQGTWLKQRGLDGLWAGLWELPSEQGEGGPQALRARGYVLQGPVATVQHLLTHRRVTATVYAATLAPERIKAEKLRAFAQPLAAPLSTLARKAIVAAEAPMLNAAP